MPPFLLTRYRGVAVGSNWAALHGKCRVNSHATVDVYLQQLSVLHGKTTALTVLNVEAGQTTELLTSFDEVFTDSLIRVIVERESL